MLFSSLTTIKAIFFNVIKFLRIILLLFRYRSVLQYRKFIVVFIACFGESGVSLIGLGKMISSSEEFITYLLVCTVLATLADFIIMITFHKVLKNYSAQKTEKESRFMSFCRKHSTLGTILYRFVPFARMPFLATASVAIKIKDFIIPNFIGSMLWCLVWTYIGYNSLSKIVFNKIYSFFVVLFHKIYSLK
jgi:membrane protein DedA with SNARE-associated domain